MPDLIETGAERIREIHAAGERRTYGVGQSFIRAHPVDEARGETATPEDVVHDDERK